MKTIEKKELKELLNKCWMTHDAMWFLHCLQECGIDKANTINKAAVKSMAMIEVKRITKILGIKQIETFDELKELIQSAFELIKADFMDFECSFPDKNVMHWKMDNCFAYDGIKKIGVIANYRCGIFDRAKGWFEGLGIQYSMEPDIDECMMYKTGNCYRNFQFYF